MCGLMLTKHSFARSSPLIFNPSISILRALLLLLVSYLYIFVYLNVSSLFCCVHRLVTPTVSALFVPRFNARILWVLWFLVAADTAPLVPLSSIPPLANVNHLLPLLNDRIECFLLKNSCILRLTDKIR